MVALCLFKELAFQPLTHSSVNKVRNPSKIKKEEMRFANNYNKNQSDSKVLGKSGCFWAVHALGGQDTASMWSPGGIRRMRVCKPFTLYVFTERTLASHTNYHCLCFLLGWFTSYVTGDELFVVGRE